MLYLEENEFFICDLFVKQISFYDSLGDETKTISDQNSVTIYLSSKSLIIECSKDASQPIYKYLFTNLTEEPLVSDDLLKLSFSKLVEI